MATIPVLERKGAASPYTSVNGHMTSYLHQGGSVAMRLPPELRIAFLERYKTTLFQAYGVVQKEYVKVPADLLAKTDQLQPYFQAGYDYAAAMKPKSTTKKKP